MFDNNFSLFNEDLVLNEAYYGKKPELIRVESLLESMKGKIRSKGIDYNPNQSEEAKEIRDIIKNLFNFKEIKFVIEGDMNYINLLTFVIFLNKELKPKDIVIVEDKNGMRYENPDNKVLAIVTNVKTLLEIPSDQLVSALLHEIGHNFFVINSSYKYVMNSKLLTPAVKATVDTLSKYDAPEEEKSGRIKALACILLKFSRYLSILGINKSDQKQSKENISNYEKLLNNLEKQVNDYYEYNYKQGEYKPGIFMKAVYFIERIIDNISLACRLPILLLFKPLVKKLLVNTNNYKFSKQEKENFDNEKFADNFAISYGYGKEISQFFYSLSEKTTKIIEEKTFANFVYYKLLNGYLNVIVNYHLDCHPTDLNRIKFTREKLLYELKNNPNISDEERKKIKKDIDFIESRLINNPTVLMEKEEEFNRLYKFEKNKQKQVGSNERIFDAQDNMETQKPYYKKNQK